MNQHCDLTVTLTAWPCTSQHGHITASLTATHITTPLPPAWAMSQHTSQLHTLHCCPYHSCICHIAMHPAAAWPHCCLPYSHAHVTTPLPPVWATLQHTSPHTLCCRPHRSRTHHIATHLAAAQAMSAPPSQPHTLHCCASCSFTHHIAAPL